MRTAVVLVQATMIAMWRMEMVMTREDNPSGEVLGPEREDRGRWDRRGREGREG